MEKNKIVETLLNDINDMIKNGKSNYEIFSSVTLFLSKTDEGSSYNDRIETLQLHKEVSRSFSREFTKATFRYESLLLSLKKSKTSLEDTVNYISQTNKLIEKRSGYDITTDNKYQPYVEKGSEILPFVSILASGLLTLSITDTNQLLIFFGLCSISIPASISLGKTNFNKNISDAIQNFIDSNYIKHLSEELEKKNKYSSIIENRIENTIKNINETERKVEVFESLNEIITRSINEITVKIEMSKEGSETNGHQKQLRKLQ